MATPANDNTVGAKLIIFWSTQFQFLRFCLISTAHYCFQLFFHVGQFIRIGRGQIGTLAGVGLEIIKLR